MSYLVDANVLCEPTRPRPWGRVVDWLRERERELAVNPIILGELRYGILLLPAGRRRKRLEGWFEGGIRHLPVFEMDEDTAGHWAALLARLKAMGRPMSVKDSLIAATALQHRLTVVTRDVTDFESAGVPLLNPFQ
ncbi:MAG: PIN domain-containing protein [Verrucomicrobiales bacterium]|nr:PIN domain-containing protein [Verrucomicrobiales bacterium]